MSQFPPHIIPLHFPPKKHPEKPEPDEVPPQMPAIKIQTQQQNIAFPQPAPELPVGTVTAGSPQLVPAHQPKLPLPGEWAVQVGAWCVPTAAGARGEVVPPGVSFALLCGSFVVPKGPDASPSW